MQIQCSIAWELLKIAVAELVNCLFSEIGRDEIGIRQEANANLLRAVRSGNHSSVVDCLRTGLVDIDNADPVIIINKEETTMSEVQQHKIRYSIWIPDRYPDAISDVMLLDLRHSGFFFV